MIEAYKGYEYSIQLTPVSPPIGGMIFSATIDYLGQAGGGKATDPHLELGIFLGKSEVEAKTACESCVRNWIDART